MKPVFFLAILASFFLSKSLPTQNVLPKASTSGSKTAIQYEVLLWTKDANIKIKDKSIKKGVVFSNTSDIKFSAANQWVNTIKVGSSDQGFIFTYDCSSGTCKTVKNPITAHKSRLETTDLRQLIKQNTVSGHKVKID